MLEQAGCASRSSQSPRTEACPCLGILLSADRRRRRAALGEIREVLPEFGWNPIVLTVWPDDYRSAREFKMDRSLSKDVEGRCEVHRTPTASLGGCAGRWRNSTSSGSSGSSFIRYSGKGILLGAGRDSARVEDHQGTAAVRDLHQSAPYSLIVDGFHPALWTRVPWVADLRDLWTQDSLLTWPSRVHYRATVAAERFMLRRADTVIANTPLAAQRMRELLGLSAPGGSWRSPTDMMKRTSRRTIHRRRTAGR